MNANDEIPQVPDDAPPAILFRLSYRANENHRSGYRPGDKSERIVASMRGWWELDPDEAKSLNIKYAVAFHRGVTRAVVEIDGWKWQDVPGSDYNLFDAIDAAQASQDVREMQMLLTDLGAVDEARRMAQIQRTLDLMVRSGRS